MSSEKRVLLRVFLFAFLIILVINVENIIFPKLEAKAASNKPNSGYNLPNLKGEQAIKYLQETNKLYSVVEKINDESSILNPPCPLTAFI